MVKKREVTTEQLNEIYQGLGINCGFFPISVEQWIVTINNNPVELAGELSFSNEQHAIDAVIYHCREYMWTDKDFINLISKILKPKKKKWWAVRDEFNINYRQMVDDLINIGILKIERIR